MIEALPLSVVNKVAPNTEAVAATHKSFYPYFEHL